jgi:hypothetical protein
MDEIPFSCLEESDGMMRDEGRGGRRENKGAAGQNEKN